MNRPVSSRPWSETAGGTDSGATTTHTGEADVTFFITHVSAHSDADATLQLKDGSTVLAEWALNQYRNSLYSTNGEWFSTPGEDVTLALSASTADCHVNMTGYSIP